MTAKLPPITPVAVILAALVGDDGGVTAPWSVGDPLGGPVVLCCRVGGVDLVHLVPMASAVPEAVAQAIASGTPVAGLNIQAVQHYCRGAGWPEPRSWIDLGMVLRLHNRHNDPCMALHGEGLLTDADLQQVRSIAVQPVPADRAVAGILIKQRAGLSFRLLEAVIGRFGIEIGQEMPVWQAHQAINAAGVPVDLPLAHAANAMLDLITEVFVDGAGCGIRVGYKQLHQTDLFLAELRKLGFTVSDARADTLEALLQDATMERSTRAMILARLLIGKEGSFSHFAALIQAVSSDGWLRGGYTFAGHRLRRWTSRLGRLHGQRKTDLSVDVLLQVHRMVMAGDICGLFKLLPDVIAAACAVADLIRLCFKAPEGFQFAVMDISSFEPCALLWLAGVEMPVGREFYLEHLAEVVRACGAGPFPMTGPVGKEEDWYGLAKVGFVAPMYGSWTVGVEKYLRGSGIVLAKYGITSEAIIQVFKRRWPAITKFWYALSNAAANAIDHEGSPVAGRVRFEFDGRDLVALLPSGGRLVYPHARRERSDKGGWDIVYMAVKNGEWKEQRAWGGKLCQNIVSSMCRDHFAEALVATVENIGPSLLHTHDEIAVLVPADATKGQDMLARLQANLSASRPWAPGLVLRAKGFLTSRYNKEPV